MRGRLDKTITIRYTKPRYVRAYRTLQGKEERNSIMRKRIAALALAAVMAFGLTACGGGGSSSTAAPASSGEAGGVSGEFTGTATGNQPARNQHKATHSARKKAESVHWKANPPNNNNVEDKRRAYVFLSPCPSPPQCAAHPQACSCISISPVFLIRAGKISPFPVQLGCTIGAASFEGCFAPFPAAQSFLSPAKIPKAAFAVRRKNFGGFPAVRRPLQRQTKARKPHRVVNNAAPL